MEQLFRQFLTFLCDLLIFFNTKIFKSVKPKMSTEVPIFRLVDFKDPDGNFFGISNCLFSFTSFQHHLKRRWTDDNRNNWKQHQNRRGDNFRLQMWTEKELPEKNWQVSDFFVTCFKRGFSIFLVFFRFFYIKSVKHVALITEVIISVHVFFSVFRFFSSCSEKKDKKPNNFPR